MCSEAYPCYPLLIRSIWLSLECSVDVVIKVRDINIGRVWPGLHVSSSSCSRGPRIQTFPLFLRRWFLVLREAGYLYVYGLEMIGVPSRNDMNLFSRIIVIGILLIVWDIQHFDSGNKDNTEALACVCFLCTVKSQVSPGFYSSRLCRKLQPLARV